MGNNKIGVNKLKYLLYEMLNNEKEEGLDWKSLLRFIIINCLKVGENQKKVDTHMEKTNKKSTLT